MEVHAHMSAGQTKRGLDLIRLSWGYMLNYKQSTNSTFWECAWPRACPSLDRLRRCSHCVD